MKKVKLFIFKPEDLPKDLVGKKIFYTYEGKHGNHIERGPCLVLERLSGNRLRLDYSPMIPHGKNYQDVVPFSRVRFWMEVPEHVAKWVHRIRSDAYHRKAGEPVFKR